MKKILSGVWDVAWFAILFVIIQTVVLVATGVVDMAVGGRSMVQIGKILQTGWLPGTTNIIIASTVSSLLTMGLFVWRRWAPFSRSYVAGKPWTALIWVAVLTLGTLVPSIWLDELLETQMSESAEQLLKGIMGHPSGYFVIGILAPLTEEVVFRGAILRRLLGMMNRRWHWAAIAVSAALFGLVHGNVPQGVHAFLLGLLLGWLYYRTNSIVPGVVLHWVNNTIAYVAYNLAPGMNDSKLIELAGGSQTRVCLWLLFSLCILLPALFQLNLRLKREN